MTDTYYKLKSSRGDHGTQPNPFDFFHINSVEKDELGNYLVSARNVHAVYYIDGRTKDIIWTLGGKGNDFRDLSDGHALNFAWQHDARFISPDAFPETYTSPPEKDGHTTKLMTLFDNAAMDWDYSYGPSYSRGLLLEVTYPTPGTSNIPKAASDTEKSPKASGPYTMHWQEGLSKQDQEKVKAIDGKDTSYTVRVVREFINPKHVISGTQGNVQLLGQSNTRTDPKLLVGYGINAVVTEFASNGSVLCDMHFGAVTSWEKGDVQSYRAYKSPWVGRPRQPPVVAVHKGHVWASWNGATEYVGWVMQASDTRDGGDQTWSNVANVSKDGFETGIPLHPVGQGVPGPDYLRVLAMCRDGQVCENGISEVVRRGRIPAWLAVDQLSAIRIDMGYWTVLIACLFVATSFLLARILRRLIRRRRRGRSGGTYASSQRRMD